MYFSIFGILANEGNTKDAIEDHVTNLKLDET